MIEVSAEIRAMFAEAEAHAASLPGLSPLERRGVAYSFLVGRLGVGSELPA